MNGSGAWSFVADVELDLQSASARNLGCETCQRGCVVAEAVERWGEAGERELAAGVGSNRVRR